MTDLEIAARARDVGALGLFIHGCYAVQGSPAELASAISCYLLDQEQPPIFERMCSAALARPDMDVIAALFNAGFTTDEVIDHHVDVAEKLKEPSA